MTLHYRDGWTEAQRAAADAKVGSLNKAAEAGELSVTSAERSGTSAASRYRSAGNEIPSGSDVDHVRDLQLGGVDDVSNMSPLNSSVNRSLGPQIHHQIKVLPIGTCIVAVRICG